MANRFPTQPPQMQPRTDMSLRNNVPAVYPRPRTGMWPQHTVHQQAEDPNEKQREYLKQQQKLRLMNATSAPQPVSADALIENLLGKKETFKPKVAHQTVQPAAGNSSQHLVGPGMVPAHVRPPMRYPIPSGMAVVAPASASGGMVGNYGIPVLSSEVKSPCLPAAAGASRMDMNMQPQMQFGFSLPSWLEPTSPHFPQFYRQVWKIVGQEKGLVDTTRIFPLLLTSGLPTDILGFIWGLANRKIAGQLTEEELYIVLALVALAQSGCTFNNLGILNLIPQPPIPNLKIVGFEPVTSSMGGLETENFGPPGQGKMKREDLNLSQMSPAISNTNNPNSAGDDDGFDEFTDFQSAMTVVSEPNLISDSKDSVLASKSETQSNTASSTLNMVVENSIKCPSVMVVSSGHGRGIGSRLANHSLGTPKQKKSKHHHHHHHHRNQPQLMSNFPISVDEDFSEFQQAKVPVTNIGDNNESELFQRCPLKPVSQGKTYLLKESAIRSEIKIENKQQSKEAERNIILISKEDSKSSLMNDVQKDKTEFTTGELQIEPSGSQNVMPEHDHVVPPKDSKSDGVNLMAVEDDKYSALRNLSLTDQDSSPEKQKVFPGTGPSPASDEFGDFLSAEPSQTVDSFADIATREQSSGMNILKTTSTDMWKTSQIPQAVEFQVDDWGEFETAAFSESNVSSSQYDIKTDSGISAAFMNLDLSNNISSNGMNSASGISLPEKENKFLSNSLEPTTDLSLENSWDLKIKHENDSQRNASFCVTESAEQTSSFQGFLGKIYDDNKPEHDPIKVDIFCSNSDAQLQSRNDNFDIDNQVCSGSAGDDDFGEFVGPDTWAEEQKYNVTTKDMLFDGHLGASLKDGLYGDSQSVSSLELPPLALSRHGSVPSLDLKIFPNTVEKNGGNGGNQPWDMSPQGIDYQLSEWQRCLQSCLTLLQSAVDTFNNISCEEVLDEVVGSVEGKDYLQNIIEVAGVSHRVECSYKQLRNSGEYRQLDSLLADIDNAWSSLESYYVMADISVDLEVIPCTETGDESTGVSETALCCGVCLADVNVGSKTNNRNISQLEYGGHVYHSVCANLWVNCVDCRLPGLASGSGSFL